MSTNKTKVIDGYPFEAYSHEIYPTEEMILRSADFFQWLNRRRSVRDFSDQQVPLAIIENCIKAASTAPSGAHKQPWTFCVVADSTSKKEIRAAVEKEEKESYENRMSTEWLEDIKPLQTDWQKPFIEVAPYLIVVFKKVYDLLPDGSKRNNYYVNESVGLACGFLLAALHHAGLVALTHTPSPMNFLTTILKRPENERPFLLIPVGYPNPETYVPLLERKPLGAVMAFY